jgi:hypothetical protein
MSPATTTPNNPSSSSRQPLACFDDSNMVANFASSGDNGQARRSGSRETRTLGVLAGNGSCEDNDMERDIERTSVLES